MIKLRTSYFASPKVKQIVKDNKIKYLVSIAQFSPYWFPEVEERKDLAPSRDLLKRYKAGNVTIEEYTKEYIDQVNPILDNVNLRNGSVLLCYEKIGEFCHRNILAKLLKEKGYEIEEL